MDEHLRPPAAQLRAFHAVATSGSFTAAAKELGVSQPAVSMHLKALEEAYGVTLITRGRGRVQPTELGEALLAVTRPMATLEAQAAEILGEAGALLRGRLQVGADAPFAVMPILAAFHEAHPGVSIALSLGNSEEVLRDLLSGRTDAAALGDRVEDPRLFAVPAAKSRQVLLVPRAHPWAKRSGVRLAELEGAPMVVREEGSETRRAFEEALAKAGVRPRVVMEIGSREALQEAVAAGLGAAAIVEAERAGDERLAALPFEDAAIEHTEYVACLAERRRLRVVAAFLALAPRLPKARSGRYAARR